MMEFYCCSYMLSCFKRRERKRTLPLGIFDPVRLDLCRGSAGLGFVASLPASWGPHHDLIILTYHSMQRAAEAVCVSENCTLPLLFLE